MDDARANDTGPLGPTPPADPRRARVPGRAPGDEQPVRRASRDPGSGWIGGVAAGIAPQLRVPVWVVRLGFVMLVPFDLVGVLLYGVLWVVLPRQGADTSMGLEAATRAGLRPSRTTTPARSRAAATLGVVLVGGLAVMAIQSIGVGMNSRWFWPIALAAGGVALVWRQADDSSATGSDGAGVERRRWHGVVRVGTGMALVGTAISLVAASQVGAGQWSTMLLMAALVLAGVALVAAPWLRAARMRLRQADRERAVADARADMAAHLHDSVLQTLALIQRQADDPRAVATLARRQERELRQWLYGNAEGRAYGAFDGSIQVAPSTLAAALADEVERIEAERGVPVDLVQVGDIRLDEHLGALVQAAAEAVLNAAKHSGADRIDVYAEVDDGNVEIFVRDRGVGFDPLRVADDRMGLRRSIIERVERHGGRAQVRTSPGAGCEIRLEMTP
ncbi:ATP-binding protein [Acidipropionibacterium timonense]|uniref:ATP-binding protein n=1 Tax=Acidipropionibacterium timonense TaxID=2161818 RepID=UPI0010303BC3|nr:ATP-binding protein [Acidipropionibacterium timonense]